MYRNHTHVTWQFVTFMAFECKHLGKFQSKVIQFKIFFHLLAANFFLNRNVLYKRNHDMVLLRCVDINEADMIIKEIHAGSFGTHANGHAIAKKILRVEYYWLTMKIDCSHYAKMFHKCQIYDAKVNMSPTPLNVLTVPWPFCMWGIGMIRIVEPKSSNGHWLILVVINYFTIWAKVVCYANVTKQVVAHFIKKDIICHYEVPNKNITDNGSNLKNKMMNELCEIFKIEHHIGPRWTES